MLTLRDILTSRDKDSLLKATGEIPKLEALLHRAHWLSIRGVDVQCRRSEKEWEMRRAYISPIWRSFFGRVVNYLFAQGLRICLTEIQPKRLLLEHMNMKWLPSLRESRKPIPIWPSTPTSGYSNYVFPPFFYLRKQIALFPSTQNLSVKELDWVWIRIKTSLKEKPPSCLFA